jgi:hypothetical protein
MLIDVQDPARNLLLNACLYTVAAMALAAIIPWKAIGYPRLSRALRWLAMPALGLAIAYEWAMPSRFDIRLDLVLLIPLYAIILMTSLVRWWPWRGATRPRDGI